MKIDWKLYQFVAVFGLIPVMLLFNLNIALTFLAIALSGFQIAASDKRQRIVIERKDVPIIKALGYAVGAWLVLMVSSTFVFTFTKFIRSFNIFSTIQFYSEVQPIFSGNLVFILATWIFFIPIVESPILFGPFMEFFADRIKAKISLKDAKYWGVMLLVSSYFTFLHFTAKLGPYSTGQNEALIMVFLMAMISMALVAITQQLLEATLFHILANGIAMTMKYNLLANMFPPIIVGIIIIGAILLIKKAFNIRFTTT